MGRGGNGWLLKRLPDHFWGCRFIMWYHQCPSNTSSCKRCWRKFFSLFISKRLGQCLLPEAFYPLFSTELPHLFPTLQLCSCNCFGFQLLYNNRINKIPPVSLKDKQPQLVPLVLARAELPWAVFSNFLASLLSRLHFSHFIAVIIDQTLYPELFFDCALCEGVSLCGLC